MKTFITFSNGNRVWYVTWPREHSLRSKRSRAKSFSAFWPRVNWSESKKSTKQGVVWRDRESQTTGKADLINLTYCPPNEYVDTFSSQLWLFKVRWQICRSINKLNRENQWGFFIIKRFASERPLSRPTIPCFVESLFSLQFTRGQNAEKIP